LNVSSIREALDSPEGTLASINGWIARKHVVGGVVFALVRDASGYMQVAAKMGVTPDDATKELSRLPIEAAVTITGTVRLDKRAPFGKELSLSTIKLVASSDKWPITKSAISSPGFLYDHRHLSIRGRKTRAIMRIRAGLIAAAFDFFVRRNFTLINAPILVQSACEGGSTLFEVDYFGQKVFLSQSAQLYEEAAIESLGKVFVLQPAFRAEKSKTARHLTEFWMIESEQAFADQEENMRLQEDLVHYILAKLDDSMSREFADLGRKITVHEPPFTRISYDEARDLIIKRGVYFEWGEDLPTAGEVIVSKAFEGPFFITGYPASARSFYHMTKDTDPRITLSADLFAPEGYGEIATGGQRIHDYETLRARIEAQELPAHLFQWYLDLRRFGMPPHSGFGLGVERMLRWICGLKHIRSTTLFPRTITRVTP